MTLTKDNMTLGAKYIDDATGFEGTLTCKSEQIGGDMLVCLETLNHTSGKPIDAWFKPARLSFVSAPI